MVAAELDENPISGPEDAHTRSLLELPSGDIQNVIMLAGILHCAMADQNPAAALTGGPHILVSLGSRGVLYVGSRTAFSEVEPKLPDELQKGLLDIGISWRLYPAIKIHRSDDIAGSAATLITNGAGDAFCGGFISGFLESPPSGNNYNDAVLRGLEAACNRIRKNSNVFENVRAGVK